jgi:hypothetical protein
VSRYFCRSAAALLVALAAAGCGGGGSTGPSSTAPRVTAISPSSGSTVGGTSITITGSNFAAGAVVTLGGVNASQVNVLNAGTLTAVTGAHAAGAADVVVAVGSQRGTLPGGYTFVAPQQSANSAPVIATITLKGTKPREPEQFADIAETINVSAAVTDAETPVPQLTFEWTAKVGGEAVGSFSGSGANVTWTAPAAYSGTPVTVNFNLKVTERYQTTDNVGLPITRENVVEKAGALRLHNSVKEVSDLAYNFLLAFSQQKPVDEVMKDFTTSCAEAQQERQDVICNKQDGTITAFDLKTPQTTIPFTGTCPFRNVRGDACAQVPAEWTTKISSTPCHAALLPYAGKTNVVAGTDQVTAVLENDRWKLCASDWDQKTSTYNFRFLR